MTDSTKDPDTSLALAQVVMLPKDVANLAKEGLKEICDLLVMQQVQVSILTSTAFQFASLHFWYLTFSLFYFVEPLESYCHFRADEGAVH